eukprot:782780_1
MSNLLKQLLTGQKSNDSFQINEKYQQCKKQIQSIGLRIRNILEEKDNCTLSKFNNQYGNLLTYEQSDEYEAKYSTSKPTTNTFNIPSKLRPKSHFPISSSNPDNPSKGNAKFSLQRTLSGHNDKIYALKWCTDNKHIVSASKDGSLIIWDMLTYRKKLGIPLRMAWVMTVDYSPNGNLIASGGLDNLSSIFNIQDKIGWASEMIQPHRELQQHEGYVSCNRFIDNQHILTSSGDSTCILWDIEYQQPIAVFNGHNGDVESIAHNYNTNNTFISGSIDMNAKVWDYRLKSSKSCINTFTGHVSDINYVSWFPDYKSFGTASDDGCCRLFDIKSYQTLNIYGNKLKEANAATCIDFSKSGYYMTTAYDEGPMCIAWNTVTAKIENIIQHQTRVSSLQFQPNGNSLVTGCWDKNLRIWV